MSTTQQVSGRPPLPEPDETAVEEYAPGELYDAVGPSRFRDALEEGVDTGEVVVVPASAVAEPERGTDEGGWKRTAARAYLRARNAVMRPTYEIGRRAVDGDAADEALEEREEAVWHPGLLHYAPLLAGAGAAAVEAAAGDADLALMTAEVTAGYAGKWTVYNGDAARHAGGRSGARAELAERARDDLESDGATVRVVPDDTYDAALDAAEDPDTADPRKAEEAIAGELD